MYATGRNLKIEIYYSIIKARNRLVFKVICKNIVTFFSY